MTTTAQRIMLFGLWKRAKAVLMHGRETWTKHEEDERRSQLTADAIGAAKSWSDLSNAGVDKIKGALQAIIAPTDLNAQLRQLSQERNRLLYGIRRLGHAPSYVQSILDRMDSRHGEADRDKTDEWTRERERAERPQRRLDELGPDELRKVMIALRKQEARGTNARLNDGAN